ncbi:MAG TPA: hypothetical protein VG407_05895 [Caulobacteraceae bacterium]|jgi:hypothetical protein|nr:hypothetical protein [Caulobacteraceae bacterium]
MNDNMRWIVVAVLAVAGLGLLVLRISRGAASGRMGAYLLIRIVLALAVLGFVAWRYFSTHHG